jgi:RND superfamily putative drug exporter
MVLAAWLVGLVAFFAIGLAVGASYNNNFSMPGTDSTQALNALRADFPTQSGDSEQVVVQAKEGTLRSRPVEEAVTSMLAKVGRLPHVVSVASPYGAPGQLSRDGKIGFATVNLDASAQDVPTSAVQTLISTAQSARSPVLNVQLGGQAIENDQQSRGSSSFFVGALLALVVLFFAFRRSLLGALLPIISALMGIGVATALVEMLTHAMPVASWEPQVAELVALGVGVDYALFVVSRHRSGLLAGRTPEEAAVTALNTSGRAVLLAGSTVCVALLGMFALGLSFLYGVAVSVALAVALTMLASLTVLPAMLGFLGPKVLRRAERGQLRGGAPGMQGFWGRWARLVPRHAAVYSFGALGVIVLLAVPFFNLRQGLPDASTDPASSTTYRAYQLLAEGFGPGFNGPLEVVGQVSGPADEARLAGFVASLRGQQGVAGVSAPRLSPNGKAAVAAVYPTTGPQQAQTATLLNRVRLAVPEAEAGTTLRVHIFGATALNQDFSNVLSSRMAQFVAVVVGLGFLLLAVVFRSLLVPLLASIMNLLSFGAALGVMTATFQYGWGKSVLGFAQSAPIVSWLPVIMFSILFGLSMDYEVFLVSRMHEGWVLSRDNERAVAQGQAETGRVITAAALIMVFVFASFMLGDQIDLKQIGLGFAAAIFVDAFVIRTVLVPAAMHVMGPANWWVPRWLDRALPHLHVGAADLVHVEAVDLTRGGLRDVARASAGAAE